MNNANSQKRKYRFNIVDVLLLCLIVLSVCAIIFLMFYNKNGGISAESDNKTEIIYTVSQKELPDILRGKINMGDYVVRSSDLQPLGQVIDFQYTDSVYKYVDPETMLVTSGVYPGKIDLSVKISVDATKSEDGIYSINGQIINVGEEMDLRFPFYTGKAVCVSVSEVSE